MRQPVPFGKYLLLDRISVGGMAEVFKAKSYGVEGFEKVIAIKRILPSMGEDRDFIKMFIDEAKIAGQLNHANICQIFELGKIDGSHFIAMEYIWGKDLLQVQNRLKRTREVMDVDMACYIIAKACEGLDYAHRKKDPLGRPMEIVHRDCSPQNVLVSFEGEVKVIDFGIARAASRSSRTQAGVLKGKFGYMSPEQVRGLTIDRRSDIFALGTVLFESLTGQRLFLGESDFSTLERVRSGTVTPPREINTNVPAEVERIVLKALAREREDRYQYCGEMQRDLRAYLTSRQELYTTKTLGARVRELFTRELDREKRLMEQYKKVGRDGLIAGVPQAQAKLDVVEELGELPELEGDPTTLGGPEFDAYIEELAAASSGASRSAAEVMVSGNGAGARGKRPSSEYEDGPTGVILEEGLVEESQDGAVAVAPAASAAVALAPRGFGPPPAAPSYGPSPLGSHSGLDPGYAAPPNTILAPDPNASHPALPLAQPGMPMPGRPGSEPGMPGQSGSRPGMPMPGSPGSHPGMPMPGSPGSHPGTSSPQLRMPPGPSTGLRTGTGPHAMPGHPRGPYPPPRSPYPSGPVAIPRRGRRASRPSLTRDVGIGIGIAAAVLALIIVGRFVFFASDDPAPPKSGNIAIVLSEPGPADIDIGGTVVAQVAEGADTATATVPFGSHQVIVRKPGNKPCEQEVAVSEGTTPMVRCSLVAISNEGSLTLSGLEDGYDVVVGDKSVPAAQARAPMMLAANTEHKIKILQDGEVVDEFAVTLKPDENRSHSISLTIEDDSTAPTPDVKPEKPKVADDKPKDDDDEAELEVKPVKDDKPKDKPPKEEVKYGYLTASTTPFAKIIVDGRSRGVTPIGSGEKLKLKVGAHSVTFVVGKKKFHYGVRIKEGKTSRLVRTLPVND